LKYDDNEDDADFGIAYSDTLITILSIFLALFILVAMLPKNEKPVTNTSLIGKICAELSWDDDRDIDIDLWGKSPDDKPVGYSNNHGKILDLYRDVLGFFRNPSHRNLEIMCAQTLQPGEWTFNAHYYNNHENNKSPVKITTVITIFPKEGQNRILTRSEYLNEIGEEKTLFDFRLDNNGVLENNSINNIFKPLR